MFFLETRCFLLVALQNKPYFFSFLWWTFEMHSEASMDWDVALNLFAIFLSIACSDQICCYQLIKWLAALPTYSVCRGVLSFSQGYTDPVKLSFSYDYITWHMAIYTAVLDIFQFGPQWWAALRVDRSMQLTQLIEVIQIYTTSLFNFKHSCGKYKNIRAAPNTPMTLAHFMKKISQIWTKNILNYLLL